MDILEKIIKEIELAEEELDEFFEEGPSTRRYLKLHEKEDIEEEENEYL